MAYLQMGCWAAMAALLLSLLWGCATSGEGPPEYADAPQGPGLEVPPDLSRPRADDRYAVPDAGRVSVKASTAAGGVGTASSAPTAANVLPQVQDIRVKRHGQTRWLQVEAPPEKLWPKLKAFWQQQGLAIAQEDPAAGVMETAWAEDLSELPHFNGNEWVQALDRLLRDSGLRDKFRLRLEPRPAEQGTEVFIAHLGGERVLVDDEFSQWQRRPSEPELEAWMLQRLMVFLGTAPDAAATQVAEAPDQAVEGELKLDDDGGIMTLAEPFAAAWRRVGVALERAGLKVDDRNRSNGVYFVTYHGRDAKGFWSRLFGKPDGLQKGEQYQVQLQGRQGNTEISVFDARGADLSKAVTAALLKRIQQALR